MARKHHKAEQIIGHLRHVEVMVGQGKKIEDALREIGVTGNTYSGGVKNMAVLDLTRRSA